MLDGYHLMIPGPVELHPEVLAEMSRPVVPHYGEDWTAYYNETLDLLRVIFGTDGDVYPIPGSGSAALEAAMGSCLGEGRRLLVLSNGFFGERLASIGLSIDPYTVVRRIPISEPIGTDELTEALEQEPGITAVAVVHSESSSGLLNPVSELAEICRKRGVLFLVDAISSLGGVEIPMDAWGIDICVCASQKCLEGPPGLGLVAVAREAWPRIEGTKARGWYLNLHVWREYAEIWADWHPFPVTLAVPVFRGLRRGIERVLEEGLSQRIERHHQSAHALREHLSELGFAPVFPESMASPTVVAAHGRADVSADEVVDRLKAEHRILVARGMGEFKGAAFRIGNMGLQAMPETTDSLVRAIRCVVGMDSC